MTKNSRNKQRNFEHFSNLDFLHKNLKYKQIQQMNILDTRILKEYYHKRHENGDCPKHLCDGHDCICNESGYVYKKFKTLLPREKVQLIQDAYQYLNKDYPVNNYFITISPPIPEEGKKGNKTTKIQLGELLRDTLLSYSKTMKRWKRVKGVIECGESGLHPHIHAILYTNVINEASVKAHIRKGNISVELRKIFERLNTERKLPFKGFLQNKCSIKYNYVIPDYLQEKEDYLIEENKESGHQNPYDKQIFKGKEQTFLWEGC